MIMRYLLLEYMTNRHAGLPVIKMLLMNGFDMTTRDSHGERALDNTFREAFRIGDLAMAKYLLEHGAAFSGPSRDRPAYRNSSHALAYGGDAAAQWRRNQRSQQRK